MNRVITIFLLITVNSLLFAQGENNMDFEVWEGGNPSGWHTSNLLDIYNPVTQTSDAYSGSYAAKGTVVATPGGTGYTAIISAGTLANGFPVNFRPEALKGWYKFVSDSSDFFSVTVAMYKNGNSIGTGFMFSYDIQNTYKQFNLNINYSSTEIPDTARIVILIAGEGGVTHPGNYFCLDALSFGSVTDVSYSNAEIPDYELKQNYPNPFNPSTIIGYSIPEPANVRLDVYDALGRMVKELLNESLQPGKYQEEFNASGMASGVYYCRIVAGNYVKTIPMVLLK